METHDYSPEDLAGYDKPAFYSHIRRSIRHAIEHVAKRVNVGGVKKPVHVFEAGFGTGEQTRLFLELFDVGFWMGVDPSLAMADHMRKYLRANKREAAIVSKKKIEDYFFDQVHSSHMPQYDIVSCCSVMPHIQDQRFCVAKLARLVRPGGYLILTAGNPSYWGKERWEMRLEGLDDVGEHGPPEFPCKTEPGIVAGILEAMCMEEVILSSMHWITPFLPGLDVFSEKPGILTRLALNLDFMLGPLAPFAENGVDVLYVFHKPEGK